MKAEQTADEFTRLFAAIYRRFHKRVHHTDYQLTPESLAVVSHLAGAGPLTVTEAARHMDRSQAAMSEMIGRLVDRGVLHKLADERDRRRTLVWLTDQGLATLDEANRVLSTESLTTAFEQLDSQQRGLIIDGLQQLLEQGESQ